MKLIDGLLNLAGLLLWLQWRGTPFPFGIRSRVGRFPSLTQAGTTRGLRRWLCLGGVIGLLGLRAWVYWRVGSDLNWVASLNLGIVALAFNSVSLDRMLIYSFAGFGITLGVFYLWLLLLSAASRKLPEADAWRQFVRLQLGWLAPWPGVVKLVLPLPLVSLLWCVANPGLVALGMTPPTQSTLHLVEESLVIAAGAMLAWKPLLLLVMGVHMVGSYLYLGDHSLWAFVNAVARNLLRPLRWAPLCWGKLDLAPMVAMALVYFGANFASRGLVWLYGRLPL